MDERERKAVQRGMVLGALGMLVFGLLAGWVLLPGYGGHWKTMLKLGQIVDLLDERFVGDYDAEALGDMAAYGMMSTLDDRYSMYLPADEVAEHEANKFGETFGVGIQFVWDEERQAAHIFQVLEGSSALEQGVQPGDWLIAAGGVTAKENGYAEMIDAIRGEEGTEVEVTIQRDGAEPFTVTLERQRMAQLMAKGEMLGDGIGLIRIYNFHQGAADQFRQEYEALQAQGMEKLIVDVRHDSGGLVTEMCTIADRFLPECDIMIMRSKDGWESRKKSDAAQDEIPMAVLVDEQSYSAAEFFAALMQEYDRAVTVGAQTTGKERAQNTYLLADGSAIVLSDQQYLTPLEHALGETGMTPDILTPLSENTNFYFMERGEDLQLQAAIEALKR